MSFKWDGQLGEKGKVGGRVGNNKCREKKCDKTKQPHASVARTQDSNANVVGPKKSTWTRVPQWSNPSSKSESTVEGPKRNISEQTKELEEASMTVKKFRMEEEAVSVKMNKQCLSVEAALQSRQEQ